MAKIRINLDLHEAQERVWRGRRRYNVVRCGRRFGKTVLSSAILTERAAQGLPVAYMAPTYKMLMDFWREIKRDLKPIIAVTNETEKRMELTTGGVIDFWSLDNAVTIRGRKYAEVVIDEAAMVPGLEEAWTMVIRPTLTDYKGGAWFMSTPKGRNYFWVLSEQARTDEHWSSWHMPTTANPYIDPEEVEQARKGMPEIAYRQEYLAEFVDVAGALMKRDDLFYIDKPPSGLKIGVGVDLAISKKDTADYTAIAVMGLDEATGHRYVLDVIRQRCSFQEMLTLIRKVCEKWNPVRVNIEEVQFQAAVVQELMRTTSLPIKGIKPDRDKVTRFFPLLARYEQAMVYHVRGLPGEFENELLSFPEGEHDDMVDALVYADRAVTAGNAVGVFVV